MLQHEVWVGSVHIMETSTIQPIYSHAGAVDLYNETSMIKACLFMLNNTHLFGRTIIILELLSTTTMDGSGHVTVEQIGNHTEAILSYITLYNVNHVFVSSSHTAICTKNAF